MSAATPMGGEEAHAGYIEETTYGTTPTNPTFLWIGEIQEIDPLFDPSLMRIKGCGSRYVKHLVQGLRKTGFRLSYLYQNKDFLNKIMTGMPYASGKPLSIEKWWTDPADGSIVFSVLSKGCLFNSITISGRIVTGEDMEVVVDAELIGQDYVLSATHPAGSTQPTDPGTTPKLGTDCKIEINASEPLDIYDFSLRLRNNLKRYPVIRLKADDGNLAKWVSGRTFDVELDLIAYLINKDYMQGLFNDVEKTVKVYIGADLYTLSNCKYVSVRPTSRVEAEAPQRISWTAKSIAITTP